MKLRVKKMREERGWSLDDLADRAGISRSYVSEIENHKKPPNAKRLEGFARAFGVPVIALIEDVGLSEDILQHIEIMERLGDQDREAILRYARALDAKTE